MSDLVVVSLEPWDEVWRRNQHLVAGLLRRLPGLRVLFVEPVADPLHALLSGRRPVPGRGLRPGPELAGVEEGRLWLLQGTKPLPRRLDVRHDERWADGVARAARRLGLEDPVLWVNDPTGATVLRRTGWTAIYDVTDDWLAAERPDAERARLRENEDELLRRCREVVVCSPDLARTKGPAGGGAPVTVVRNAVDVDRYLEPRPRPGDLPEGPVALYLGTLHADRIDLDLCARTAEALAGAGTLVAVGPALIGDDERRTLETSGVVLLGPRDRLEVPAYLQHADVLVVPHVVSAFTDSLDPIKLYEYAAVGRPVVSTPVAGFRDVEDPRVRVVGAEDFPEAVRDRVPARTSFPEGSDPAVPSWDDRVAEMARVLARVGVA